MQAELDAVYLAGQAAAAVLEQPKWLTLRLTLNDAHDDRAGGQGQTWQLDTHAGEGV